MKKLLGYYLLSGLLSLLFVTTAQAHIKTMDQVNLEKFVGTWYRAASNPIIFEPKCACARQVLTPQTDGKVAVYNSCNKDEVTGKLVEIRGTATAVDSTGSKLSVDFGLPWHGSYWILAADADYNWAVVTDRWGYSLYIMSRTPEMDPAAFNQAVLAAKTQVRVDHLVTSQNAGCQYPPIN